MLSFNQQQGKDRKEGRNEKMDFIYLDELIKQADELKTNKYKTQKEARQTVEELNRELQIQENRLLASQQEISEMIWKLRNAESATFNFWVNNHRK